MANKTKKRKPGRKMPPLSRVDLLPLAPAQARDHSLRTHMALVAVRSGYGDLTLLGELLRTVFVTYFLCKAEGDVSIVEDFVDAERGLKAGMDRGEADGVWDVDELTARAVENVLMLQDHHLATKANYRLERAKQQLRDVLDQGAFPDIAADYDTADQSTHASGSVPTSSGTESHHVG